MTRKVTDLVLSFLLLGLPRYCPTSASQKQSPRTRKHRPHPLSTPLLHQLIHQRQRRHGFDDGDGSRYDAGIMTAFGFEDAFFAGEIYGWMEGC